QSAGCLLYREGPDGLEVLLVHPSGNYNRKAPWGIPKGIIDEGEDAEQAARRETWEETGVKVTGPLVELGNIVYVRSRKHVHCFAGPAPEAAPPGAASGGVDPAQFLPVARARAVIHPDQLPFIDRLEALLKAS